jgi:hypothetical protein
MTDSPGKLESELLAMRPSALRGETLDGLSHAMSRKPSRAGDWCLMGAIGSGLAASLVIVAMLTFGMTGSAAGIPAGGPVAQAPPERAGDSLMIFARADNDLGGILK